MEPVLGIIGGMGPLASAEFMSTLYEFNLNGPEQTAPRCVLYSDPSVPDRTQAIKSGNEDAVMTFLTRACAALRELGAERFVIPCMTAHYFVRKLPEDVRARTISLVDVLMDSLGTAQTKLLLLATTGTRQSGILAAHPRWASVKDKRPGGDSLPDLFASEVRARRTFRAGGAAGDCSKLWRARMRRRVHRPPHADAAVAARSDFA